MVEKVLRSPDTESQRIDMGANDPTTKPKHKSHLCRGRRLVRSAVSGLGRLGFVGELEPDTRPYIARVRNAGSPFLCNNVRQFLGGRKREDADVDGGLKRTPEIPVTIGFEP